MTRSHPNSLADAAAAAGSALQRLAPDATSALVDCTGSPYLVAVFADGTEIDTSEGGPFDRETLGEADALLREGFDRSGPEAPESAGWQHVSDGQSDRLYRIAFTAAQR
ncbi:hypothetical protein ACFWH1_18530 [Streptomyces sp. NPDC127037]|uniref:hypothetical protein n=1 Tax=Streptomyces sp. NPDC127037 TaxID=3347113 RepID=UPI0036672B8C